MVVFQTLLANLVTASFYCHSELEAAVQGMSVVCGIGDHHGKTRDDWNWPVVLLADVVTNQRSSVSERQVSGQHKTFLG